MSSTACSTASSWAARASSMRPIGSNCDQLGMGPSGTVYRPRSGMAPYWHGTVSRSCARRMVSCSNGSTGLIGLNE